MSLSERDAVLCQLVDVGTSDVGIAITAQFGTEVIHGNEQDIGPAIPSEGGVSGE